MNTTRKISLWAGLAAVLALIAWGLTPRPVGVDVRAAARGPLAVTVVEEGRTRVIDRYVVSAPIAGYARRVELDVGDLVERGQALVHLDPMRSGTLDPRSQAEAQAGVAKANAALSAAEESVEAARAEAELARNEYERVRRVAGQGLISQGELDAARARWRSTQARQRSAEFNVEVARGELEAARATLEFAAAEPDGTGGHMSVTVSAPVDGRVLKVIHESEGAVVQGQPLLELGDPRALEVEVELLSADAVKIHQGTRVRLLRWGGERPLEGVVRRVEPSGFTKISALGVEEQRVLVICDISSEYELWRALGDGYRVEAEFVLWESDNALQVPAAALFRQDEDWAVFTVAEGRARLTPIGVGAHSGLAVEVKAGLQEGDQVIIYPGEQVREGVRVRPRGPAG
jgi:HlyD family secretion protein